MTKLIEAVKNNNTLSIKQLLTAEYDLPESINQFGTNNVSALHIACIQGFTQAVALLLAAGADVNQRTPEGHTPLYLAAEGGHKVVVEILLAGGATCINNGFNTAIGIAAENNRLEVVSVLEQFEEKSNQKAIALLRRVMSVSVTMSNSEANKLYGDILKYKYHHQWANRQFWNSTELSLRLSEFDAYSSLEYSLMQRSKQQLTENKTYTRICKLVRIKCAAVTTLIREIESKPQNASLLINKFNKKYNEILDVTNTEAVLTSLAGMVAAHDDAFNEYRLDMNHRRLFEGPLGEQVLTCIQRLISAEKLDKSTLMKRKFIIPLAAYSKHSKARAAIAGWRHLAFETNDIRAVSKAREKMINVVESSLGRLVAIAVDKLTDGIAFKNNQSYIQLSVGNAIDGMPLGQVTADEFLKVQFSYVLAVLKSAKKSMQQCHGEIDFIAQQLESDASTVRKYDLPLADFGGAQVNAASTSFASTARSTPQLQQKMQLSNLANVAVESPKMGEAALLACAIQAHQSNIELHETNKAAAHLELQQTYSALTSQQSVLINLESKLNCLRYAGIAENAVRIDELQTQHDVVAEQVGILFNRFMREQARIQAIEAFSGDPRLADFYSALQNLLGNVVIGYKAAASGVMQIQSSEVGGHFDNAAEASTSDIAAGAFKSGTKKLGKFLGKNADKIISTASQGITLLGHSFEFLPGVGALLKGAGKVAGMVAEKRAMNRCIQLSEQITMPIFLGASQQLAFQLTQQFKAQLLSLPLPSDEKSSMAASAGQKLFKSAPQSSVRKLAEYAVLMILESFHQHNVPQNTVSEDAWVQHWLDIVHNPRQPSRGPVHQCLGKLGVNSMIATTQHKARWNLTQLFAETGIQVPGAIVLYYARTQRGAQLYGFRAGTQSEAKRYQMVTVSGPHQSASTTQASSASVKHVAQQITAARQQMGAIELQARQMHMHAKRNNSNRLENDVSVLKMNHQSIFQPGSVKLQQQGAKLTFTFAQPALREPFVESLCYLGFTTTCRLLEPGQVELVVKAPSLANKLKAQLLQQGMNETITTAPTAQYSY